MSWPNTPISELWDKYECDRNRILFLCGYTRFERDAYSHCDWTTLPLAVQDMLLQYERETKEDLYA